MWVNLRNGGCKRHTAPGAAAVKITSKYNAAALLSTIVFYDTSAT